MTKIIEFGDLAALKAKVAERDKEIERLTRELREARTAQNNTKGINDILRLQLNDLLETIKMWRGNLDALAANVVEMKAKLPE